jgi:ribosomal protein S19
MDPRITEMRKQKRLQYMEKVWLPTFFEKYKVLMDPKLVAVKGIQKFIRRNFFLPAINITEDQIASIPGIYRLRIIFNTQNLTDKKIQQEIKIPEVKKPDMTIYNIRKQQQEDKKKQQNARANNIHKEQQQLNKAIAESLKSKQDKERKLLTKALNESQHDLAVQKSLFDTTTNTNKKYHKVFTRDLSTIPDCVCLDLRVYGPDPYQPIYIADIVYYLSKPQIRRVQDAWNKVNGKTRESMRYMQDFEYYKALAKDKLLS